MKPFVLVNVRNSEPAFIYDANESHAETARDAATNAHNWRTVNPELWAQFVGARRELETLRMRVLQSPKPAFTIVAGEAQS